MARAGDSESGSGGRSLGLGRLLSWEFRRTPRRVLFTLSYYKFAARMIGPGKSVLDVGCGEGLGTRLLAKECGSATGIDFDAGAIRIARRNWAGRNVRFLRGDFLKTPCGIHDAAAAIDVIEHILPGHAGAFLHGMAESVTDPGVVVIGTPNLDAARYASKVSMAGHVNLYSAGRLEEELSGHFARVFLFAANDEVVHTGFMPLAHYLIAVCCGRRKPPARGGKGRPS